jgi:hypothetical protein
MQTKALNARKDFIAGTALEVIGREEASWK